MQWTGIREELPKEHYTVLVARDHFGDEAQDYFVATYFEEEDEWQVFLTMPSCAGSNYIRVTTPVKSGDKWTYFEGVNEDAD